MERKIKGEVFDGMRATIYAGLLGVMSLRDESCAQIWEYADSVLRGGGYVRADDGEEVCPHGYPPDKSCWLCEDKAKHPTRTVIAADDGEATACDRCLGSGRLGVTTLLPNGEKSEKWWNCPQCSASPAPAGVPVEVVRRLRDAGDCLAAEYVAMQPVGEDSISREWWSAAQAAESAIAACGERSIASVKGIADAKEKP